MTRPNATQCSVYEVCFEKTFPMMLNATLLSAPVKRYRQSRPYCRYRRPLPYPSCRSLSTSFSPSTGYPVLPAMTLTFLLALYLGSHASALNVSSSCPCKSCPYRTLPRAPLIRLYFPRWAVLESAALKGWTVHCSFGVRKVTVRRERRLPALPISLLTL